MATDRALLIKPQYLSLILRGVKTVELRKTACKRLGWTALAPLGCGSSRRSVVALARFSECEKLKEADVVLDDHLHSVAPEEVRSYLGGDEGYFWYIAEVLLLKEPVSFPYIRGQVNYARLSQEESSRVSAELIEIESPEALEKTLAFLENFRRESLPSTKEKKPRARLPAVTKKVILRRPS